MHNTLLMLCIYDFRLSSSLRWRHGAQCKASAGAGTGARIGSLAESCAGVSIALVCEGRWRRSSASVGKGARTGHLDAGARKGVRTGHPDAGIFIALACEGRWHVQDTGAGKGARTGHPDAGVFIALACEGRWRRPSAGAGREPECVTQTLAIPLRWRVRDAGVG
jgi:hypothetical protein